MSLPAALFLHAQDVSEIRNTATVYGNNMTQDLLNIWVWPELWEQ